MPLIEIEVKFYIKNYEKIIKKIKEYSDKHNESSLEKNTLFDTKNHFLKKSNKILRLRTYLGKTILTFKQPSLETSPEFKKLEESEVFVNSFDEMKYILSNSGFIKTQIYEKQRQIFSKGELEICVDRLPFGDFIELEGTENEIKTAVQALGFDWNKKILPDYISIFEKIKKENDLLFNDITFKNFKEVEPKDFSDKILSFCL
ncbi:MAG: class IV adenylate cyclase [Desulforegulaceae bacterium]|nr:class IV adenylate cyclase [Desulforegulaceae bacterium]